MRRRAEDTHALGIDLVYWVLSSIIVLISLELIVEEH